MLGIFGIYFSGIWREGHGAFVWEDLQNRRERYGTIGPWCCWLWPCSPFFCCLPWCGSVRRHKFRRPVSTNAALVTKTLNMVYGSPRRRRQRRWWRPNAGLAIYTPIWPSRVIICIYETFMAKDSGILLHGPFIFLALCSWWSHVPIYDIHIYYVQWVFFENGWWTMTAAAGILVLFLLVDVGQLAFQEWWIYVSFSWVLERKFCFLEIVGRY